MWQIIHSKNYMHCSGFVGVSVLPTSRRVASLAPWWCHQIFSALLAFCAGNSPVTDEFPAERPVTWSFDGFFLICAWINGWVNNREAGDLRCHHAHYDVIVMTGTGVNNTGTNSTTKRTFYNGVSAKIHHVSHYVEVWQSRYVSQYQNLNEDMDAPYTILYSTWTVDK